jgi:hypothetical protein
MRQQQLVARALWLVATLTIGAAYAGEGPAPSDKAKPGAEHGKGEHGKPGDAAAVPGKAEPARGEPAKGEHGKPDEAAAAPGKDDGKDKGKDEGKARRGPHAMRDLFAELKAGKLKKGELKDRLGELKEQRDERMKEHREELKTRFGAALAAPSAREELEHHARRMAKLDRAMVLAETEVTKDKDKLKERIQKLIDKENARHEAALEKLKAAQPAAGAAAAAPAAPATPPAPVAIEKGAEK